MPMKAEAVISGSGWKERLAWTAKGRMRKYASESRPAMGESVMRRARS